MSSITKFVQEGHASVVASLLFLGNYAIYLLARRAVTSHRQSAIIKENGCKPIPAYPHKDPLFGLDLFLENSKSLKEGVFMETVKRRYSHVNGGVHTFSQLILGSRVIGTSEPENIKAILATKFNDFGLPQRRKDAFEPMFGHGIFSTDGDEWAASRALLRPSFSRSLIGDLDVFEIHVSKLLSKIPRDGSTVDLQDLFFKLTLDSATDFLFGESANVLGTGQDTVKGERFGNAFNYAMLKIGLQSRVGKLATILPNKRYKNDVDYVISYVNTYVQKAVARSKELERSGKEAPKSAKYVFLDELSKTRYPAKKIQDELLNILLAGRDTTASLLSHLWYILARRPDVFNKLRSAISPLGNNKPTFEQIKDVKYLQYCLNETLRLYPVVPANGREAINDTVLPLGGGADGNSPIFVAKGTQVNYQVYVMQRRKDLYGEDADEFKPERWETLRPGWQYLPFNGGPRICIGQQFALTEASYATIRLLQEFKGIKSHDDTEYRELLTITNAVWGGVQVGLTPA